MTTSGSTVGGCAFSGTSTQVPVSELHRANPTPPVCVTGTSAWDTGIPEQSDSEIYDRHGTAALASAPPRVAPGVWLGATPTVVRLGRRREGSSAPG
jgi:hypothetical protein